MIGAVLLAAAGIWVDVPFIRQEKEGCGAAAIAMVMEYWSRPADAAAILRKLHSHEANGIYAADIKRYFEEQGFHAFALRGTWAGLRENLAKGRPLIVCLGGKPGHYVVVAGMDDETVSLNDPTGRKLRKTSRATFEKNWKAAGFWMLLAVPREAR